jgi:alpha-beta hydrolase superfamily lysophospholipase
MRSIILVAALVYLCIFLYAYFFAEKIIFQPPPSSYRDGPEIIKLDTGNGEKISAIHLFNQGARHTILYSHGNAEDLGHVLPFVEDFRRIGFSVLAYDYRGYGTSEGAASEKNAYRDADAAYEYLTRKLGVPSERIIAMGRSLGGAVAVDLAHRQKLGGLIIESSLVTAYRVMTHIPLVPFDQFTSISKIGEIHCPVLVMHGTKDEVIPFWHGEKLFQRANQPRLSLWVEGAGHSNLAEVGGSRYEKVMRDFANMVDRSNARQVFP